VPTGFVVAQVSVTLQLLAPAAMVQEGDAGVSVPDSDVGAAHVLPFHVVPDVQLEEATLVARSCASLYRKNVRAL